MPTPPPHLTGHAKGGALVGAARRIRGNWYVYVGRTTVTVRDEGQARAVLRSYGAVKITTGETTCQHR